MKRTTTFKLYILLCMSISCSCSRSSLHDRPESSPQSSEPFLVHDRQADMIFESDSRASRDDMASESDSDGLSEPDAQDTPKRVLSSDYVLHPREKRLDVCASHPRGCFQDVRPKGLPLLTSAAGLMTYIEDDSQRMDYEEILEHPHYVGIKLKHRDGKYHLFECPVETREDYDYVLEDVYVRCHADSTLTYKFHEKEDVFSDEERMVYDACVSRTKVGPKIDEPWFSLYKQAIGQQSREEPFLLTHSYLVASARTYQGFELGEFKLKYRFGDRNVCGPPTSSWHNHEDTIDVSRLDLSQPLD